MLKTLLDARWLEGGSLLPRADTDAAFPGPPRTTLGVGLPVAIAIGVLAILGVGLFGAGLLRIMTAY